METTTTLNILNSVRENASSLASNITDMFEKWEDTCGQDPALLDLPYVKYPFWAIYIVVFAVCLLGNLFTIIVITFHPQMRTPTNFFLANLAGADLLVALFCILQNMVHILGFEHGHWPLGALMCKLYVYVLHMVPSTSVGVLVCVSAEKYIAVLHPLVALKMLTKRLRTFMTMGVWAFSLALNFPFFYSTQMYTFGEMSACGRSEGSVANWIVFSFVLWYILPLVTMAFIYTKIGIVLWRSGQGYSTRTSTSGGKISESGGQASGSWYLAPGRAIVYKQDSSLLRVPEDKSRQKDVKRKEVMESRRKVVRLLFIIVLSFACLTFSHHARLLHSVYATTPSCNNEITALLQPLSFISMFLSSTVNPILYAFLSKRFRDAAKDILKCKCVHGQTRSRNRTLVSDMPDDSRMPSRAPSRCSSPTHQRRALLEAPVVVIELVKIQDSKTRRP